MFDSSCVLQNLSIMVKNGRLPHAMIFAGNKACPKEETAKELARILYESIGRVELEGVSIASLLKDDSLPEFILFSTDSSKKTKMYSRDSIREILSDMSSSSMYSLPRFIVFTEADFMSPESSNILLKNIEEPIDDLYFILFVENLDRVLSTIKSRCEIIRFADLNKEEVALKLINEIGEATLINPLLQYSSDYDELKTLVQDSKVTQIYEGLSALFRSSFEENDSLILGYKKMKNMLDRRDDDAVYYDSLFCNFLMSYLYDMYNYKNLKYIEFVNEREKERIIRLSQLIDNSIILESLNDARKMYESLSYSTGFISLDLWIYNMFLRLESSARKGALNEKGY